jgi:long-chain fatty acid transport protein
MLNNTKKRAMHLAIMPMVAMATLPALAGGLYVGEFGQPNQGASGAGAQALAEDASTAWQNPAGIMFLDGDKSMVTALIVNAENEFEQNKAASSLPPAVANADGSRPASDGGDAGGTSLGGAVFHADQINDNWGWGLSLVSISAAVLEYEDEQDFAGRYWATEVDMLTITLLPSLSYKVTNDFSVGLGVPIMFAQLDMDVVIPGLAAGGPEGRAKIEDGDDIVVGLHLSALWEATDSMRLGLIYVAKTDLDFDSDLKITPPPGQPLDSVQSNVEFTFPQTLRGSLTQDLTSELTLLASLAWEDWSEFKDIAVSTSAGGGSLPRNWDDTWHYSLGLRWKPQAQWTYYTGITYDTDPTQASDRTADMPIDEQWRYSGGVTYERQNGHKIGVVLTYADYGDAAIKNGGARPGPTPAPWTVDGDYSSNRLIFLGLNYSW